MGGRLQLPAAPPVPGHEDVVPPVPAQRPHPDRPCPDPFAAAGGRVGDRVVRDPRDRNAAHNTGGHGGGRVRGTHPTQRTPQHRSRRPEDLASPRLVGPPPHGVGRPTQRPPRAGRTPAQDRAVPPDRGEPALAEHARSASGRPSTRQRPRPAPWPDLDHRWTLTDRSALSKAPRTRRRGPSTCPVCRGALPGRHLPPGQRRSDSMCYLDVGSGPLAYYVVPHGTRRDLACSCRPCNLAGPLDQGPSDIQLFLYSTAFTHLGAGGCERLDARPR